MGRGSGASAVKLYYRIGEVAGIVGVEPHVLRYWESEFPTIRPQKSRSGQRVYSRRDVDKLLRVKELLYTQRFTIAGARQRLREFGVESVGAPAVEAEAPPVASPSAPSSTVDSNVDGLRSSAQTLRATLLAARHDVCRLLESLSSEASESAVCEAEAILGDRASVTESASVGVAVGSRGVERVEREV